MDVRHVEAKDIEGADVEVLVCEGFVALPVPPSPKFQDQVAIVPLLWSVKSMLALSAEAVHALAVKPATGGFHALTRPTVGLVLVQPIGVLTVRLTL